MNLISKLLKRKSPQPEERRIIENPEDLTLQEATEIVKSAEPKTIDWYGQKVLFSPHIAFGGAFQLGDGFVDGELLHLAKLRLSQEAPRKKVI